MVEADTSIKLQHYEDNLRRNSFLIALKNPCQKLSFFSFLRVTCKIILERLLSNEITFVRKCNKPVPEQVQ